MASDLTQAQRDFVEAYTPLARDIGAATGLDASLILGQIAQETGWGQHVKGNNIFGISPIDANGRQFVASYPDVQTASNAYVDLIKSRYANATTQATPMAQARALVGGGYNRVDPTYADKLSAHAATIQPIMAMDRPSDTDMAAQWGVGATAPAVTAVQRPSDADMLKTWGVGAGNDNAPPAPVARAAPDYAGWDQPTPQAAAALRYGTVAPEVGQNILSYRGLSQALAPAPNTTYGQVLPLARDNATGQLRLAMPQIYRDLGQGALDLAQGPATGAVTPQGTAALATVAGRLTPSPAAGTGAAIANSLAAREAPQPVQNPLAVAAPNAPAFIPPGTPAPPVPPPAFIPPEIAAQRPNILSAAPPPTPGNKLATGASAAAEVPAGLTSQQAAEYAAIPERLPPAPIIPPVTKTQAEARADQLIQHFAARSGAPPEQDLVPGFVPTLAQRTNDPGIATLERGVQAANPGALDLRKQANQQAIRDFTAKLVGTPEDVDLAQTAREQATAPLRDAAFAKATPVDVAPVAAQIDTVLAGPDGKREAVRSTLQNLKQTLHSGQDAKEPLETDPEQLYGIRKHINDMLAPAAQRDNPQLQRAASVLSNIKTTLDNIIEQGAPGFKDYVAQYEAMSRPIDEMQYLQGLNLTDQAGNVAGGSVDRALKTIAKLRNAPGANKAMSISDDTIDALKRLHTTLQVARYTDTAGKPLGSNTFQNLATNSRVGAVAGNPLVHSGLGAAGFGIGGIPGAVIGAGVNMGANRLMNNAETMVKQAMIERLLNLQGKGESALAGASRAAPSP